jgi:protein-S-isoprenylcysteine O-methyltransferase Ste14
VVVAAALLVVFSLACGLGVLFNQTAAILVGWVGFGVTVLIAYWTTATRPRGRSPSRSTKEG